MFTVKVREPDHSESVFEALQVSKRIQPKIGDQVGDVCCETESGDISYPLFDGPIRDGGRTMWVMNRFGATVATYAL